MIGILLTAVGTFFSELASSFGKWDILHKRENLYIFGFLNTFWVLIIFIVLALVKGSFIFSSASIPLLGLLIVLEFAQSYSTLHAIVKADRSTMGFLMVGTLPLLLGVDVALGYDINLFNLAGVSVIVLGLIALFLNHGINKKGVGYVIFSTVNAVATISIYKYCITYYNSVEAQQIITCVFLLLFLYIMSIWKYKENPLRFILKREFLIKSFSNGLGSTITSIAYVYAPASVITSGKRAFSILWSVISGSEFFHEKHIVVKIVSFLMTVVGLSLLAI